MKLETCTEINKNETLLGSNCKKQSIGQGQKSSEDVFW